MEYSQFGKERTSATGEVGADERGQPRDVHTDAALVQDALAGEAKLLGRDRTRDVDIVVDGFGDRAVEQSARSELVPLCRRVHRNTALSTSDTTSIRWVSSRCATEMIAMRGLPAGVKSSDAASSGSPALHASNPGAASTLLKRSASS